MSLDHDLRGFDPVHANCRPYSFVPNKTIGTMRSGAVSRAVMALVVFAILTPSASAQSADQDVNTDCTCDCKTTTTSEESRYNIAVGGPNDCTAAACKTAVAGCPSTSLITSTYHDCTCHCCGAGICNVDGATAYPFNAGSPERCTVDACSAKFYQCPQSPNYGVSTEASTTFVAATYTDCTCGCCREGACIDSDLVYKMFFAGSPDSCTASQCSSKFYACPDSGSHNANGRVEATYNGVVPENVTAPAATPSSPSGGITVTKKSTELPTYAAALITILVIGLVGGLVGIFVHRKVQAERGFRWVKFDEHDGKDGVGEGGEQRV